MRDPRTGLGLLELAVVRAVAALRRPTLWWRDAPYVLRQPDAAPAADLPTGLAPVRPPQDAVRRVDACACYATQLGYQFGRDSALPAEEAMRVALAGLDEVLLADAAALEVLAAAADAAVPAAQGSAPGSSARTSTQST